MVVIQVIKTDSGIVVEVMDEHNFEREWRTLEAGTDVREGDRLWWQMHIGRLTRYPEFADLNVGKCFPAAPHGVQEADDECNGMRKE